MPTHELIPVVNLRIDTQNPRLEDEPPTNREAIQEVAKLQQEKLVSLARDIVEFGINPSDSPIVIPSSEQTGHYTVLEGNRRLSAIKALENPDLLVGVVADRIVNRFRKLHNRYQSNAIEEINCVVFDDRAEADHWIELRHTGENEGAGIVRWGAQETARFKQRRGEKVYHMQALDFLEQRGDLSHEKRQEVPISSLERILSNPDIRAMLGLEMKEKVLYTRFDEDEVAKGLSRIVDDLASGKVRTGDIYHKNDRIKYVNGIDDEDLPDTSSPTGFLRPLIKSEDEKTESSNTEETTKPRRKGRPSSKKRKRLIPVGYVLNIDQTRINNIYHELKNLNIENYTNAVSVLLRVFLELSLDSYIERKSLNLDEWADLSHKLQAVGQALKNNGQMNSQQLKAVRRASNKDYFIAANISTFNQYVHNQYFTPAPSDLRAAWDSLEPFIAAVWDSVS